MIAAIYARKSTEQNGAAEEAKSVTRQTENGRAFAVKRGWTVADEHVYVDDAVSGALFDEQRPGLARLLNALKPKPAFDVLVMSEESRIGRDQYRSAYVLQQVADAAMVTAWPARNFSDLEPPTYTASVPVASALAFTFLVVFIVGYLHDVASTTRRARSPSMIESGGRVLRRSVIDVRTTSLTLCKSPLRGPLAPRPA